jgi:hypothetical protein
MPKHYKEMIDEIINKMDEDAPANAVAHGGVDMNPTGKLLKKKKQEPMKRLGEKIKEENDNNNVTLRGVLDTLNKVEKISDQYLGVNEEIEVVEEPKEEYKTFRDKFNG